MHVSGTSRSILIGLALSCTVTAIFNVGNMLILARGPEAALERHSDTIDEDYYLALIGEAADGHTRMGNAALKEHRDDQSIVTRFPLVHAGIMRATGISRWQALILMDILCPLLLTFLFFLAIRGLLQRDSIALFATIAALSLWSVGLLNAVNPKMVLLPVALYLAILWGVKTQKPLHYILRGVLLGVMLYVYPHFFLFFSAVEGCDLVRRILAKKESNRSLCLQELLIALPLGILALPKVIAAFSAKTPEEIDVWHRFAITSHQPSGPMLQLLVLLTIIGLWIVRQRNRSDTRSIDLLLTCLSAALLALNQSVLHGIELMFALHYERLLLLFVLLSFTVALVRLLPAKAALLAMGALCILSTASLTEDLTEKYRERVQAAEDFSSSDAARVIETLQKETGELVVLAPLKLANLIPTLTSHYVVINEYARFQSVTDKELADRYVLKQAVEPTWKEYDQTFGIVFSVHAGNAAARARTWCRITSLFQKSAEECRMPITDFIVQQDVLRTLLEELEHPSSARTIDLLDRFHVDRIVTEQPLEPALAARCRESEKVGTFTIHRCSR